MRRRDFIRYTGIVGGAIALSGMPDAPAFGEPLVPAALHPTLPQHDGPLATALRRTELLVARTLYRWTERFPFLEGIPKLDVPPPQEVPSPEFLKIEGEVLAAIVENLLVWAAKHPAAIPPLAVAQLTATSNALERLLAKAAPGTEALTRAIADVRSKLTDLLVRSAGLDVPSSGIEDYDAIFQTLELPEISRVFRDDDAFAWLRVAGFNPLLLRAVPAPPATMPISDADFATVMGGGDSLERAGSERRLFLVDYSELGDWANGQPIVKEQAGVGYAYRPLALFARPIDGESLVPVAIKCTQDADAPVFLPVPPDHPGYWGWQMAKTVVQHADFNYHELRSHLSRTHLVTEAFAVAMHRQLARTHPLFVLLSPHFEGTLIINARGAVQILGPKLAAEVVTAPTLGDALAEVREDRLRLDWGQYVLLNDLTLRGVADPSELPDYPYRDDSLLVWDAIRAWVTEYVDVYYSSDADVAADTELAAWAHEVVSRGKLRGFDPPSSKSALVETMTAIVFNCSAQHAAVNFPQRTLMTYVPSSAGVLSAPAPTSLEGYTEEDWKRMLPPPLVTIVQLIVLGVLGGVYYRPLGEYRTSLGPAIRDPRLNDALARFRASLDDVESTIEQRNLTRVRPYRQLLPSQIPASTNI